MKIHRVAIRLIHLLLAWTIIAVTFALGFFAGQKLDPGAPFERPASQQPFGGEPRGDALTTDAPVHALPLEITAINGTKLTTTLSAGAPPRAYEGPALRTVALVRATKIFRVTFTAQGLPEVREVKSSALAIGQQITVSSTVDLATLATLQPNEIRILD